MSEIEPRTIRKTYQYRLYPTPAQEATLNWWLRRCCWLYNACLTQRRWAYEWPNRKSLNYYDQQNQLPELRAAMPEMAELHSNLSQNVVKRVDLAFQAFFRRKLGFPKYRAADRYDSMTWPSPSGWKVIYNPDARYSVLRISRIGDIKVRMHRPIEGDARTCTIRRKAGQWYVTFSCRDVPVVDAPETGHAVGIDLRLRWFLVTSDGAVVENPHYLEAGLKRIKRLQRKVSRQKRGSNRRKETIRQLQRAHMHVASQRKHFHHVTAKALIDSADIIGREDISPSFMVEKWKREEFPALAQAALDAGWSQFVTILETKAAAAGRIVVAVDPKHTTSTCSQCGTIVNRTGASPVFECRNCGLSLPVAENAARNVLTKALGAV